jgi:hypothetical protein
LAVLPLASGANCAASRRFQRRRRNTCETRIERQTKRTLWKDARASRPHGTCTAQPRAASSAAAVLGSSLRCSQLKRSVGMATHLRPGPSEWRPLSCWRAEPHSSPCTGSLSPVACIGRSCVRLKPPESGAPLRRARSARSLGLVSITVRFTRVSDHALTASHLLALTLTLAA